MDFWPDGDWGWSALIDDYVIALSHGGETSQPYLPYLLYLKGTLIWFEVENNLVPLVYCFAIEFLGTLARPVEKNWASKTQTETDNDNSIDR